MKLLFQLQQILGFFLFSIVLFIALVILCCIIVHYFKIPDTTFTSVFCILVFVVIPWIVIIWKIAKYQ